MIASWRSHRTAGWWLTALVGALAVAALVLVAVLEGGLTTANRMTQILAARPLRPDSFPAIRHGAA
ncbi:hypothetical protein ACFWD7_50780 [Streptomyces mirabilis]|uniref:hypothetical protein n=1 Tax=Streptomyces mirabilis TaxID=68239 RepID=UPI00368EA0F9